MHRRSVAAHLILVAIFVACSSDDGAPDAGGTDSDAGGNADGSAPADDAAPSDAAVADAALPDAAVLPDARVGDCGRIQCDCTFKGIALVGEVQYVTSADFPDIRVRETPFPDLRVREGGFADECGEWEIVDAFPDFTVEIVTSFEDFGIEYSSFPGIP